MARHSAAYGRRKGREADQKGSCLHGRLLYVFGKYEADGIGGPLGNRYRDCRMPPDSEYGMGSGWPYC